MSEYAVPNDLDLTAPLREAIAEAEELIRTAEFIRTEQDLLEGYDYLSGRIRAALQLAFDHDPDRPLLINSTHQFSRQGLDNPDAIYWHVYLDEGAGYVVRGRRGTTADLNFQILGGAYTPGQAPSSLAAFDDRELDIAADRTFEFGFGPPLADGDPAPAHYLPIGPGAKSLIIREVFNDWDEERGSIWIERPDRIGRPARPLRQDVLARKYALAAKMITGSIRTWFAFPHLFTYPLPVNTLSQPASTPGGLPSQRSSLGHYSLAEDEAMIVTVPEFADCSYQAIQIGSDWYVSTDYETHQTSLTKAQSVVDPDHKLRYVISERNPGIANWLETLGHRTGPMMLRWQRLERDLGPDDGPEVEVVPFEELPERLPHYSPMADDEYRDRIAARQRAVARRMIS